MLRNKSERLSDRSNQLIESQSHLVDSTSRCTTLDIKLTKNSRNLPYLKNIQLDQLNWKQNQPGEPLKGYKGIFNC